MKVIRLCQLLAMGWLASLLFASANTGVTASNDAFNEGTFGGCTFSECPLTLSSSSTVNINVAPVVGTKCTIQKDSVGVLTDATTGYTLTFNDTDSNNHMAGASHGGSIAAVGGTRGSPAALTANKWGYRIDDSGGALGTGFGGGPTTSQTNIAPPATTFAAPPTSGSDELATSAVAADPTVTTSVWYGLCADNSISADTYSDGVTYTALIN